MGEHGHERAGVRHVTAAFERLGIAPGDVRPCSSEEIDQLERALSVRLPAAYRDFLLWMGHGAGDFLLGSHWCYEHLVELQDWAGEGWTLPDDAFVFFMHQGYQLLYFRLSDGGDPPVHLCTESESKVFADSLGDWLLAEIESAERFKEELEDAIRRIEAGED